MKSEDELLQEFLQLSVLCETRIGSDIASREAGAKTDYEAAQGELLAWKLERNKKDEYLKTCKELGIKPDSAVARRMKAQAPDKYAYDPKVLQKSEAGLSAMVANARQNFAKFHHLAVSREDLKAVEKSAFDINGIDPPEEKKAFFDIEKAEPMTMYSWNDPRWAAAIAKTPLGLREKGKKQGEHPGESRLAIIFGAMKQGDNVSFDLKTPGGWKWEVKGLASQGDLIRPGTLGIKAFKGPHRELMKVCTSMKNFVRSVNKTSAEAAFSNEQERSQFDIVNKFVNEEIEDIERGEISNERIVSWRRAVLAAAWLRERFKTEFDWGTSSERLSIAGRDITIPREKYIVLLRKLMKMNPGTEISDLMSSVNVKEVYVTALLHPAFDDVDAWLDEWDTSIDVKKIFADVAGVIVVYHSGFMKVPRKFLDRVLKLARVSKGIPYYAVSKG